jgi:hypothetical protein
LDCFHTDDELNLEEVVYKAFLRKWNQGELKLGWKSASAITYMNEKTETYRRREPYDREERER